MRARAEARSHRRADAGGPRTWRFDLDSPALPALGGHWLDAEERRAADRRSEPRASRARAARIAVRGILAAELDVEPAALRFASGAHGKPAVVGAPLAHDFNLSHSGRVGLLAVARPGPVGVDVEEERPGRPFARLARRCFAPEERRAWEALPDDDRMRGFYALWSCKEAVLKALGRGLSLPLAQVRIDARAAFGGAREIGVDWPELAAGARGADREGARLEGVAAGTARRG